MADKLPKGMKVKTDKKGNWIEIKLKDGTTVEVTRKSLDVTPEPSRPGVTIDKGSKPVREPDVRSDDQGNGPIQDFGMNGGDPVRLRMKVGDQDEDFIPYQHLTPSVVSTGYYDGANPGDHGPAHNSQVIESQLPPGQDEHIRTAFWDEASRSCWNTGFYA